MTKAIVRKKQKPDPLKKIAKDVRLFIHIPTLDGTVQCGLLNSIAHWATNMPLTINQSVHMIPLDYARNYAINHFLSEKRWTHFMGIDEDISPMSGCLELLLMSNKDAISPLIFTLKPDRGALDGTLFAKDAVPVPFPIVCERRNGGMRPKNYSGTGPVEVDLLPGGLYLVKRRVLEKIAKPAFRYKYHRDGSLKGGTDRFFSERLRASGFKMYVHPNARAEQSVVIGASAFNNTMNRYCTRRKT